MRVQAMPFFVSTERMAAALFFTDRSNFTAAGFCTRFWKSSKTNATPLIASGRETGTRDGRDVLRELERLAEHDHLLRDEDGRYVLKEGKA